jgi:hypothetical protein
MLSNAESLIKSAKPLYVLHLSSGKAKIYFAKQKGATLIEPPGGLEHPSDLSLFAAQWPDVTWVILVDQSEETFWGGVMPIMRGSAKKAWIDRMSLQSGAESTYRWSELQGKSRSQPDKLRVLGYTLGRAEGLTPWLDALQSCEARIRGMYAPVMLTPAALSLLKIKPLKKEDDIGVLVTPHADGLRQSVLVGGKVRFSRLALHAATNGSEWFETVYRETARLREYLVGSGLLKSDRAGMHLYVVMPPGVHGTANKDSTALHARDQYQWVENPLADLIYVAVLAKKQPFVQLAPLMYCKRDLSIRIARALYITTTTLAAAALIYLAFFAAQLWQKQLNIEAAQDSSSAASKQYQAIAKNFPPTPLTAQQLVEMSKRWDAIKAATPPNMRDTLVIAGQILARHPGMVIDKMEWTGEVPSKPAPAAVPGLPPLASKEKKEIATLVLGGSIRGIASDDLRGTRDALSRLMLDFNRNPDIRAEVTKKPLDLSTKASLSGSGKQESSELSFEIKLWQR